MTFTCSEKIHKRISILGTEYKMKQRNSTEDPLLEERDGYCDSTSKTIIINDIRSERGSVQDLEEIRKRILRHEIIHAFLFESGLDVSSEWGSDETLVDWIALQFPKMIKAFDDAKAL